MEPRTTRRDGETDEEYEARHAANVDAWRDDQDVYDRDPPEFVQVDCDVWAERRRR